MTNDNLEQKIRTAVHHAAPDQLDAILSACGEQKKGTVISMTSQNNNTNQNRKKRRWAAPLAVAAALALVVSGVFGMTGGFQTAQAADSVVTLDINPSISLTVDTAETVTNVTPLNDDGKAVLGGMELEGTNLETAVNALIGACLQKGYLDELQNAILVSVEDNDAARATQLQSDLTAAISGAFQEGSVLTQTVTASGDLTALAQQYGISTGKASLIQEVVAQDSTLSFDVLAPLSVSEISLIAASRNLAASNITQTGAASDQAYIGQDAALQAACTHAGVDTASVQGLSMEFDWEQGVMVYEMEFCCAGTEYDYDINALDGAVVKFSQEPCDHSWHTGSSTGTGSGTGTGSSTSTYIGEDAAKSAACTHAGVDAANAQSCTVKLDYDDGMARYEVEFCYAGTEYEYEIDAVSGSVVKFEQDTCDHYAHRNGSTAGNGGSSAGNGNGSSTAGSGTGSGGNGYGGTGNPNSPGNTGTGAGTGGRITADAALQAACTHAGLTTSQITGTKVELDWDDGTCHYDVEFRSGTMEYEYEINANTGAVIKYEQERD